MLLLKQQFFILEMIGIIILHALFDVAFDFFDPLKSLYVVLTGEGDTA